MDQAKQEELRARDRWISAGENYKRRLDSFKMLLGLPTDARISLDREELLTLSATKGELLSGPAGYGEALSEETSQATPADATSGNNETSQGEVFPEDAPVELIPPGRENAGPIEIDELAAVKLDIRNRLRDLLESRERLRIQVQAEVLARKRVKSSNLYLQAGLAEIRDLLKAQEALISAQNAVTSALVAYRVAELELQRDMEVLEVNEEGIWREYVPGGGQP